MSSLILTNVFIVALYLSAAHFFPFFLSVLSPFVCGFLALTSLWSCEKKCKTSRTIALGMRVDMWTSNTMRLYVLPAPMSNHSMSSLMSNFFTDRQDGKCDFSPLIGLDLSFFIHSFWLLCWWCLITLQCVLNGILYHACILNDMLYSYSVSLNMHSITTWLEFFRMICYLVLLHWPSLRVIAGTAGAKAL